ncbi:hypothetical protein AMAG_06363 [Allomyces macrogynus ATCC 38327]|uniref:Protein farnesyltransferase subunit beta n=1 Tax=Allomyces macrogynus (strain ATCC 38327) TaxID=578462 RepID=A0A0L0SGH2_ALLM3|nr:hypothetical protein AMAG_06363 [Allomyces macrogynus ATCC 38327]|eukprot:KNE61544.1 hypothetical protein AMAG_06363 [Allomyces macrogynus ATCC 38327]
MSTLRFANTADLMATGQYDDNLPTHSSEEQADVECDILAIYESALQSAHLSGPLLLRRPSHAAYLHRVATSLPRSMSALAASRPWLVYYVLHSMDLLGMDLSEMLRLRAASTLLRMQDPNGGFAGGVGMIAHLAPTYAAVHALALVRDEQAWRAIDRAAMYAWLLRMKRPDGSFICGTYCALTVARLLNILTPELTRNCASFIGACQSYTGGLAAVPHAEAHGGYTFCGVAAAVLLGEADHVLDIPRLARWTCMRQMPLEGGFQGRENKLVDGCYSLWVGGVPNVLVATEWGRQNMQHEVETEDEVVSTAAAHGGPADMFDREALQEYILLCCQAQSGGLLDKPDKFPDPYHTAYVLSGLSAAQHYFTFEDSEFVVADRTCVVGPVDNLLNSAHPIHNIRMAAVEHMCAWSRANPVPGISPKTTPAASPSTP